jgi:hypothetical protein
MLVKDWLENRKISLDVRSGTMRPTQEHEELGKLPVGARWRRWGVAKK